MNKTIKLSALVSVLFFLFTSISAFAATVQYTYDTLNHLIKVERNNGTVIEYTYDEAGNRLNKTITFDVNNNSPEISDIDDQFTCENTPTNAISFTIGDSETPAEDLILTGASSNATLIPNSSIVFGGSGANRIVTIIPASGETGAAIISIAVSDGSDTVSGTFMITVAAESPLLLWEKTSALHIRSTPALGDNGIFYTIANPGCSGSDGTGVIAMDPMDGSILWGPVIPSQCIGFHSSNDAFGAPSIGANGLLYGIGDWNECGDGRLVAFNSLNGSIVWNHNTSSSGYSPHPRQQPAINDALDAVYFGSSYLYSVDMDTSLDTWVKQGGYYIGGRGIAIDSLGNVYYGSNNGSGKDTRIRSYRSDGIFRWEKLFINKSIRVEGVFSDNKVILNNTTDECVTAFDTEGNELWQIDEPLGRFIDDESNNIYSTHSKSAEVISWNSDATERWRLILPDTTWSRVNFVDNSGHIYVTADNILYAVNTSDGIIEWTFTADADLNVNAVLASGGRIFLSDSNSGIYLLDTSLDYAASAWPIAQYGNRRHTQKSGDILTLPGLIDSDGDSLPDSLENMTCTNPNDADTDDDGILDGTEDANHNGQQDGNETDPCDMDSDNDGIYDGTELGYTLEDLGADTNTDIFHADLDPSTNTNPLLNDSDGDGFGDGQEDLNGNGICDFGETDPCDSESYPVLRGDVNGDGEINLTDAVLALRILSGLDNSLIVHHEADVNNDGEISAADLIFILQKAAGFRQ